MKRFLVHIISFGAFTVVVYLILVIIWGLVAPSKLKPNLIYVHGGYGNLYSRLREADTTKNVDILFLGTSHAYRSYDTRIFKEAGYKIFNLGSSAQTPAQTEYLLKKHIHQLNPKLVVLDIYPLVLGSDGIEPTLDLISNNEKLDGDILKMVINENNIRTYNALIYSYFRRSIGLDKHFIEPAIKGNDIYIKGGYVQTNRIFMNDKNYIKFTYDINDSQFKAVERIIARLKSDKIPYIIVQAPLSNNLYKSITNNGKVDSTLAKLGIYHNFNDELALPDSVFADDNHLNQNGVNIYDSSFIKFLNHNWHIKP